MLLKQTCLAIVIHGSIVLKSNVSINKKVYIAGLITGRLCKAENQKAESQKAEVKRQKIKWQKNQKA